MSQSATIETYSGEQIEVVEYDVLYYTSSTFRYVCKATAIAVNTIGEIHPSGYVIFDLSFVAGSKAAFLASTPKLKVEVGKQARHFEFLFSNEREALDYFIKENEKIKKERQDILSDARSLTFLPMENL